MASLRAHLFVLAVRAIMRARIGTTPDIASLRRIMNNGSMRYPKLSYREGRLGGVPGEWIGPQVAPYPERRHPALLYLHGGGFIACSARQYRSLTGCFAKAGFRVFAPDYRLAPEHPFPSGLEDAIAAWTALSADGPAVIAGDSAGGNLALGVMTEARRRGLPLPAAACLFSPSTDLLGRGASIVENAKRDAMFTPEALLAIAPAYLQGVDPADPRASPLEADLTGLPPLLIHCAEREMLRDDSVALAERAEQAGVAVRLKIWPVVPHAWQLGAGFLPEANRSLGEAADFMRLALARASAEPRLEVAG